MNEEKKYAANGGENESNNKGEGLFADIWYS